MRRMGWAGLVLFTACAEAGAGSARIGELEIRGAFLYAPVSRESGSAYLRITNHGQLPDSLDAVSSPIAGDVAVHGRMTDEDAEVDGLPLAVLPGFDLVLEPGGRHLMLMDLNRQPIAGDTIEVALRFVRAGTVTVRLPVRDYAE